MNTGNFDKDFKEEDFDYRNIEEVELCGIDVKDYPDFVDAYVTSATYHGKLLTEDQLDKISDDREFIYEWALHVLYGGL